MPNPKLKKPSRSAVLFFRATQSERRTLEQIAADTGRTLSNLIAQAMREWVEQNTELVPKP